MLILLQISPGKLSESHKNLEGVDNCLKCHAVAQKITNDKCLNCHTEIKNLISNEKGYHYFVKDENCANCHKEHFGRNFKLVNFDEKSFDHNLTKFKLEGAHAKLKCSSCHNQKFFKGEKYKNGTFLGLGTKCLDCHQDAHMGQLSQNCLECHTFEKWDLALKTFNHDKARFKLTGLHKNVNCYSCHPKSKSGNVLFTVFKNLNFSSCSNCHNDFHKGKFGECEKCHSTTGWQNLKIKFDHNLTDYKLDGMHNLLKCEKCHNKVKKIKNESDYISNFKIRHKLCLDCHTDYHGGVFMKRKSIGKVSYKLIEAENYNNCNILVVGGGDSAVESAMALANQINNNITISYRGDAFKSIKQRNRERIQKYIQEGKIKVIFNSNVKEIKPNSVILKTLNGEIELPNDYVFIFIGGTLPYDLLKKIGVEIIQKSGN